MIKKTEWAYLAGIIDGEGCITSYHNGYGSYYVRIRISQVDPVFLYWIQATFGGRIWSRPRHGHEQFFTWGCESITAKQILVGVYPYLKLKKRQAVVAYRLCRKGKRILKSTQLELHQELSRLKVVA